MFHSFLLAVDTSYYSDICAKYAIEYAKQMRAKIQVLSVLDRKELAIVYPYYYPSIEYPPVFDVLLQDQNTELMDRQKERTEERVAQIGDLCRTEGVECETIIKSGLVYEEVLDSSQDCDLLFMGMRGTGAIENEGYLGSNLEKIVRRSKIPVIATPQDYRELRRILICFDGSKYAIKAMSSMASFVASGLASSVEMHLIVTNSDQERCNQTASQASQILTEYHLNAELHCEVGQPAEKIVETALKVDVDIVVMGAYGHSQLRVWMLGSTTESILRQVNRAIFLQH